MAVSAQTKPLSSVILVGGPDSGKSNYIFRFWLAINNNEGCMVANGLPERLEYLQDGCQSLLKGEFAQHTPHDVYSENVIPFSVTGEGCEWNGEVIVPDCHGERWLSIFKKREWTQEWEDRIAESCGVLMFVRASSDQINRPLDWIQCEKMWGGSLPDKASPKDFAAPTQVVMVDWLQFIAKAFSERFGSARRPRVSLVVSAWDRVPEDRKASGPTAYIAEEFPLLAQFLESNRDFLDSAVFGISIAGGDFNDEPGFKEASLAKENPLSGGYVIHDLVPAPAQESDMTLPVAWALGIQLRTGG
jgi:hypothetical protein